MAKNGWDELNVTTQEWVQLHHTNLEQTNLRNWHTTVKISNCVYVVGHIFFLREDSTTIFLFFVPSATTESDWILTNPFTYLLGSTSFGMGTILIFCIVFSCAWVGIFVIMRTSKHLLKLFLRIKKWGFFPDQKVFSFQPPIPPYRWKLPHANFGMYQMCLMSRTSQTTMGS